MPEFEKGQISIDTPAKASFDTLFNTVAISSIDEQGRLKQSRVALPVDVDAVAQKLGLVVQRLSLPEGVEGMLVKDEPYGPFKAVLDIDDPLEDARFTLAHEIGHFVHQYQDFPGGETGGILEKRSRGRSIDENEVWADSFAYELLMPTAVFLNMWAEDSSVEAIADRFGLSTSQVTARALELGLK